MCAVCMLSKKSERVIIGSSGGETVAKKKSDVEGSINVEDDDEGDGRAPNRHTQSWFG
jgi:hypothetical protein